jgi:hypothetical protein
MNKTVLFTHQPLNYFIAQNTNTTTKRTTCSRPTWQEYMLLPGWGKASNTSSPDKVYRRVLKAVGVFWNHLTHLRSSGIEQASTWGLDCFRLATMSKHLLDKINRFYMSESNREVLLMMAGFIEEGISYFVPRTHVEIPNLEDNKYVSHIFPRYEIWLEEARSPLGDKNKKAASNFLLKTLPLLARVVIQDAPYHLKNYPESAFSKFFTAQVCNKYPEYAEYCSTAIEKAKEIERARNTNQTRDLNVAAQ